MIPLWQWYTYYSEYIKLHTVVAYFVWGFTRIKRKDKNKRCYPNFG